MFKDLEKLTIFLTRFGIFKNLVILFNLYNSPTSWQHLINDTLFDFCIVLYKYTLTIFLSTIK